MARDFKDRRPIGLRRSWLFVPGLDADVQSQALGSGADVVVADLEEFTQPVDRPAARQRICQLIQECRDQHVVAAVRINKLEEDGIADLEGIMAGAPQAVLLPHTQHPEQIARLSSVLTKHEVRLGLKLGSTEIVPTLESALAIVNTFAILTASSRVSACLLAAEDLSADLDLERGPDGVELHHIRARFVVECIAAGCLPIDCPFNYRDQAMLAADLQWARRVGFKSKCAVFADQVANIHAAYTPSGRQVTQASELLSRYAQQRQGVQQAAFVAAPDANTARRIVQRYEAFELYAKHLAGHPHTGAKQ